MSAPLNPLLLPAAGALALGMVAMGVQVLRAAAREKRLQARITTIAGGELRRSRHGFSRPIARAPVTAATLGERLAMQFGFNPARTAHYPLRPWMILALTLAAARGLTMLSAGMLGDIALFGTPVAWVLLSRATFGGLDDRWSRTLVKQFPDALSMIVRSVRVGIPVSEAVRVVAREAPQPTASEFSIIVSEMQIGAKLDEAVKAMSERTGLPEYRFFATTLSLQATAGGGLSETLAGLADVIRKRLALRSKGMAMASQARTSAGVLISLPFLSGGGMYLLNKAYISVLFEDPLGTRLLGMAAASLVVGVLVMRTIIRKSLA
jgi:tight adherence protein B